MPKKKTTFEEDILRLEDIVNQVDDRETALDTAMKLYKEGITLVEKCTRTLTDFESQVQVLEDGALSFFENKTEAMGQL